MMTKVQLSEIRNRAQSAITDGAARSVNIAPDVVVVSTSSVAHVEFLEQGPADVLALLEEVRRLRTEAATHKVHTRTLGTTTRALDRARTSAVRAEAERATSAAELGRVKAQRQALRVQREQLRAASQESSGPTA